MDGRMLRVFHWHSIASIHLMFSGESIQRPPSINLVQHQVRRMLGLLWRMSLMRSFGCRRMILRLNLWNGLDRYQVHCRVVQVCRRRRKFWNLGRRGLAKLLLLRTSMSWKVAKVHRIGYAFTFPNLDDRVLDDQGGNIILDLDVLFTLSTTSNAFPFIVANPKVKKALLLLKKKKEKKKRKKVGRSLLRQVVSSCSLQ